MQELFAPPVGLELEITIQGKEFYSSDKLKKKFLIAFEKSSRGKPVYNEVESLVDQKIVIPCFQTKGLLKFVTTKISGNKDNKYVMAFYYIPTKKVIILIDNSMSIFGTAANDELASTTMHECMHLVAGRSLVKFVRIFYNDLQAYYNAFLTDYFELENLDSKPVAELIKHLAQYEPKGPEYVNRNLSNYYKFMESTFLSYTKLEQEEFKERLVKYIVAVKLFIVNPNTLIKSKQQFSMLFTSLNKGYEGAFRERNTYTMPIQELISLSEVACVLAEMSPRHESIKKLFKAIA